MSIKRGLRRLACFAVLALAGVLAAVAAGPGLGAVNLPTVTLPTLPVSTPTVTVPVTVTVPTLPTPPPPVPPPPLPPAPLPPPPVTVPGVTVPGVTPPAPSGRPLPPASPAPSSPTTGSTPQAGTGGSPAQSSPGSTGGASRSGSSTGYTSSRAAVAAGPRARPRVHLTGRHPTTRLAYRLQRGGVVHVVVLQVGCGRIAAFPVRAHGGTNTLRVGRTMKGRRLADGTYRIRGRAHGRTVLRATLVVGKGGRAPCTLAAVTSDLAAVFGSDSGGSASSDASAGTSVGSVGGSSGKLAAGKTAGAAGGARPHPASGVLGAAASKVLPGDTGTELWILIALAGAILLLALGALPREVVPHPAAAAFLARRRVTIAAAGLAALTAFLIAHFIA